MLCRHWKREQEGGCGVRVVAALQLFSRVENTDHSLTLPTLRSSSSNELPGIDCDRAFIPPLLFPRGGGGIHMSPAIYGLLHTRSHAWISYHVCVSGALSWFDKAPVFVCSCMSTHGGTTLFMHEVVVFRMIADFLLKPDFCDCSKTSCPNIKMNINLYCCLVVSRFRTRLIKNLLVCLTRNCHLYTNIFRIILVGFWFSV